MTPFHVCMCPDRARSTTLRTCPECHGRIVNRRRLPGEGPNEDLCWLFTNGSLHRVAVPTRPDLLEYDAGIGGVVWGRDRQMVLDSAAQWYRISLNASRAMVEGAERVLAKISRLREEG